MIIKWLELNGFRNYERLRIDLEPGLNVFAGPNGVGKTNIVEAIHYLSLARSFRTSNDELLIKKGRSQAAVRALIKTGESQRTIGIAIGQGKKIIVNNHPIAKISELSELVNVLVFEPRDVLIYDDLPKARRKFLDIALIKHERGYLEQLTTYEKLLKERNELLKRDKVEMTLLDVVTKQLVAACEPIVHSRAAYLERINDVIDKIVKALKGDAVGVKLRYQPFVELGPDFLKRANQLYARTRDVDLRRKLTNNGVHREDFQLDLNENDVASFGSQGENRLASIALKLSPYFLIEDKEKRPIVVLDDVMSELDGKTQERLLSFLLKMDQVFITTTKYSKNEGVVYDVDHNKVQRRNGYGN